MSNKSGPTAGINPEHLLEAQKCASMLGVAANRVIIGGSIIEVHADLGHKNSVFTTSSKDAIDEYNRAGCASIQVGFFNRSDDSQRRAERYFRKTLTPGILSPLGFEIDYEQLEEPSDFALLAQIETGEREISLSRVLVSVDDTNKQAKFKGGFSPGLINYNLLVDRVR